MDNISFKWNSLSAQLLFVSAVVLAVFYPTIWAEISLIDDMDMMNWLLHSEPDLKMLHQILLPGDMHGGYYRPLVGSSFWFDRVAFGADPVIMHLEGVVFHLVNVILVFVLTRECLVLLGMKQVYVYACVAALLFGLHPITTESVNWISGRTDIMMSNFVLLGVILLLRYKRVGHRYFLISALLAVFIGSLAKEAAFGCLLGVLLLLKLNVTEAQRWGATRSASNSAAIFDFLTCYAVAVYVALYWGNYWIVLCCFSVFWLWTIYRRPVVGPERVRTHAKLILIAFLMISVSVALLFLIRRLVFSADVGKIGSTIKLIFVDPNYSISLFLGAIGFYVQKFVFPWPLNFFILEIDPIYDLAGIAVMLMLIRFFTFSTISTALFIAGMGLILPVLPFAFGTIAWTSYAERYIYLPSAFWSTALLVQTAKFLENSDIKLYPVIKYSFIGLFMAVIIICSVSTWQRNIVWQRNITLLQDTVAKSPKVKPLRDFYMSALFRADRYDEALEQYNIGKLLYSRSYDPAPDIMMGFILQSRQNSNDAYQYFNKANIGTGFRSETSLRAMIEFLELARKGSSTLSLSDPEIQQLIVEYRSKLEKLRQALPLEHSRTQKGNHS